MRPVKLPIVGCLLFTAACSTAAAIQGPATAPTATLFEGARLISGAGGAPIENSAFLVEGSRFSQIGKRGELKAPAGTVRVDLTGKTVIPALIDAHSHIGYMKDLTSGPQNYTRENILDHMHRFAYFGVAASQAMGTDFGELPFQIRDEMLAGKYPDAARFLTAGRGLAPLAEISAGNMRHAAYAVTTEQGARAAVQELALRKVTIIKTWVDDRGGAVQKLTPNLYRAIIDEAHKHGIRVAVHATQLADAKDLLRAGIDVFAHMISDVDDELVALFKQHPNTSVLTALGGPRQSDLRAVAQSAASARDRDGVTCADQATAGPAGRGDAGRARARAPGVGALGARDSPGSMRPASRSARRPTAADRPAINSSAGRCTRKWRTWSRRA